MPAEITMPQLSDTMTEGTVVKWLKKEGDKVKEGEIIAEIETDKATMEYESSESGTIARLDAAEGQKVPVGQRIALIATGSFDDGTTLDVTDFAIWTSTDSSVADVSNASGSIGEVSGFKNGKATIVAQIGSVKGGSIVTVK